MPKKPSVETLTRYGTFLKEKRGKEVSSQQRNLFDRSRDGHGLTHHVADEQEREDRSSHSSEET
jgi:hypothetical protein